MSTATIAPNAGAETGSASTAESQPVGGSQNASETSSQPVESPASGQPETSQTGTSEAVAQPETPGVETPASPAKESEGSVPWNNDPRFKQFLAEKKEVAELREIVPTASEARQLVEQVEQSRQIQQDYDGLQTQFREDPIGLATDWKAKSPESFGQLVSALHPGMMADFYDFAAASAAPEVLQVIQRLANQFLDKGSRTQEAQRRPDPKIKRLENEIAARDQREHQSQLSNFQNKVEESYVAAMQKEFDKMTEGTVFPTSDLKEVAFQRALQEVQKICDNDPAFKARISTMTGRAKLSDPETVKAVTAAILNRARVNGLFATTVSGLLKKFGAAAKSADPPKTEAQKAAEAAGKRTEVSGSGAAANGTAFSTEAMRQRSEAARKAGKDPYAAILGV